VQFFCKNVVIVCIYVTKALHLHVKPIIKNTRYMRKLLLFITLILCSLVAVAQDVTYENKTNGVDWNMIKAADNIVTI
jgi:hypothetical protein